ncbi:transcriptional regulator FtsR [Modestobacter sp. SYSU DS0290]
MSAVPRRDTGGNGALLTIGEVLAALRGDFPDVTISKIRYLESEQLVHPQRTPSGYRKFSAADVARLRYVLAAQRDQYLPLRVIKEHLEALDRGEPLPGHPEAGSSTTDEQLAAAGPMPPAEFAEAAGVDEQQLADYVQFGLVSTDRRGRLQAVDLPVVRAAAALARHGLEARHLRAWRTGADREAATLEQLVAPVLRARSDEARSRAAEQVQELAGLSAQLHTALLEARLRAVLGG